MLRPGFSSAMTLPAPQELMCLVGFFVCFVVVVVIFNQDSYCIVNSQWHYHLDVAVFTFQAGVLC